MGVWHTKTVVDCQNRESDTVHPERRLDILEQELGAAVRHFISLGCIPEECTEFASMGSPNL